MEQKELTPSQALNLIYQVLGEIALKRTDAQQVDKAIAVLATLLPKEEGETI
jgi:hypothetical protein